MDQKNVEYIEYNETLEMLILRENHEEISSQPQVEVENQSYLKYCKINK